MIPKLLGWLDSGLWQGSISSLMENTHKPCIGRYYCIFEHRLLCFVHGSWHCRCHQWHLTKRHHPYCIYIRLHIWNWNRNWMIPKLLGWLDSGLWQGSISSPMENIRKPCIGRYYCIFEHRLLCFVHGSWHCRCHQSHLTKRHHPYCIYIRLHIWNLQLQEFWNIMRKKNFGD